MKPLSNDPEEIKQQEIINRHHGVYYKESFGWELLVDRGARAFYAEEDGYHVVRLVHQTGTILTANIFDQKPTQEEAREFIAEAEPAIRKFEGG